MWVPIAPLKLHGQNNPQTHFFQRGGGVGCGRGRSLGLARGWTASGVLRCSRFVQERTISDISRNREAVGCGLLSQVDHGKLSMEPTTTSEQFERTR